MKLSNTKPVNNEPDDFYVVRMVKKSYPKKTPSDKCPVDLGRIRYTGVDGKMRVFDERTVYRILQYRPHLTKNNRILWRADKVLLDNLVEAACTLMGDNNSTTTRYALYSFMDTNGKVREDFGHIKSKLSGMQAVKSAVSLMGAGYVRPVFVKISSYDVRYSEFFSDSEVKPETRSDARFVPVDKNVEASELNDKSNDPNMRTNEYWFPIAGLTPGSVYFRWPVPMWAKGYAGLHNKDYYSSQLTAHERARITRRLVQMGWITK